MASDDLLRKKIKRIQLAQEEAERLLEEKSRELYHLNSNLEKQVEERTREFEQARDEAIAANKAKSQFLANMSHEIRTPLNGMLGFLGLLEKSELTDTQKEQLNTVTKSGKLLLTIINDILEFSKIEAGKLEIDRSEFHLKRCVEDIIDVLSKDIFEKSLELPNYLDECIPKNLIGDESRIRQVLLNLIGNAVKFTPTGEIAVNAHLDQVTSDGKYLVTFEVVDTGVGISKKNLESIFEAFEQADISDTRKYGGTGLGLTISNQIVLAMGGRLRVESEETKGSRFFFQIPLELPTGEEAQISNRDFKRAKETIVVVPNKTTHTNLIKRLNEWNVIASSSSDLKSFSWSDDSIQEKSIVIDSSLVFGNETTVEKLLKGGINIIVMCSPTDYADLQTNQTFNKCHLISKPVKREALFNAINNRLEENKNDGPKAPEEKSDSQIHVLLVEDNLINQQVALAMLKAHAITADIANNGQEAIDKFDPMTHQVILMDCQMPVMDGFDSAKALLEEGCKAPIIAMTANAFKKTKEECFEAGMSDFITKPVNDSDLFEIIQRNLRIANTEKKKASNS